MSGRNGEPLQQASLTARLIWFRSDHPDAVVETEMVVAEGDMAVCRASIATSDAGGASGHGSALREEVGSSYVEVAEDRALSRALSMLGYATDAEDAKGDEPESTVPIDLVSARSLLREEASVDDDDEDEEPQRAPQPIRQEPPQQAVQESSDDDGADVTWNKFWNWARPRGYSSARELNEMLGVDNVLAFTPREVRQMIVKYEMDNPPGGQDE